MSAFWFAHDDDCVMSYFNTLNVVTEPECWTGTLDIGGASYRVAFAHLELNDAVINCVSWTDASGQVVQAADLVAEMNIEIFRPASIQGETSDSLWMHALALHQYVHMAGEARH